MMGNFSPHEAFAIGGTNSVRGYEEGAVGSGRSYAVGSGEISFPVVGGHCRQLFFWYFIINAAPLAFRYWPRFVLV